MTTCAVPSLVCSHASTLTRVGWFVRSPGAEDTGLPEVAHEAATDIVRIPMNNFEHVRSINLATSVGVGIWEALRQLDGPVFDDDEV